MVPGLMVQNLLILRLVGISPLITPSPCFV